MNMICLPMGLWLMMLLGFVSSNKFKNSLRSVGDNDEVDKEKSNEPDYDEDQDQLEEKQEEEIGKTTINKVS
jgi:hypothetical protein